MQLARCWAGSGHGVRLEELTSSKAPQSGVGQPGVSPRGVPEWFRCIGACSLLAEGIRHLLKAREAGGPLPPGCCTLALRGLHRRWNKATHLSEPSNQHTSWDEGTPTGGGAQVPGVLGIGTRRDLRDAGGLPGVGDSSLGPPRPCPLPAHPPALPSVGGPAVLHCAKDNALFTLQGASLPGSVGSGGLGARAGHVLAAGTALGWLRAGLSLLGLPLPQTRFFSSIQPPMPHYLGGIE